ncbi:hypothetical protein Rumeso_02353 [Rubellimicrobium mesophilum DSM 19309]|uniref:Uncharacterized protein n=1 Tax=Rubellimicrobium mesophilum DSM 19309 TaxID=442562 RepID=A0A017HNZ9_9RHOB|nr:hypothetical protein [Rubellimicrobium mesophilum]EYD76081.1 hypothetical protein Rumeso_02353 [Rubellimicrobium mesophilum DSM 19309]
MDETNNNDPERLSELVNDAPEPVGKSDNSAPSETEPKGDGASNATIAPLGSADRASGHASLKGSAPDEDEGERYTKAELIELGRKSIAAKKKSRLKARARAAEEKAKGLLVITLKTHKDHRQLVMALGKLLIATFSDMRAANLKPAPLAERLKAVIKEYHDAEVRPLLKNGKS